MLWGRFVMIPILQMKTVVVGSEGPTGSPLGSVWLFVCSLCALAPQLWNEGNSTYFIGLSQNVEYLASCQHLVHNQHSFTVTVVAIPTSQPGKDLSRGTELQDAFLLLCPSDSITGLKRTWETVSSAPHFTDKGPEAHCGSLSPT